MSRCRECDIVLFALKSIETGLCEECRNPDLYDALESAMDLEEKFEILLNDSEKKD